MPRDASLDPISSPVARQRGRWIPWMFVAAFAVVSAVNGVMIYFATSTFSGIAVEKPFERGIAYNKLLAAAQVEAKLGWEVKPAIEPTKEGGAGLAVAVLANGTALEGATAQGRLHRPVEPMPDRPLTFELRSPGRFFAKLSGIKPGQWDLILVVERGNDRLHITHRLLVP